MTKTIKIRIRITFVITLTLTTPIPINLAAVERGVEGQETGEGDTRVDETIYGGSCVSESVESEEQERHQHNHAEPHDQLCMYTCRREGRGGRGREAGCGWDGLGGRSGVLEVQIVDSRRWKCQHLSVTSTPIEKRLGETSRIKDRNRGRERGRDRDSVDSLRALAALWERPGVATDLPGAGS